MKRIFYIILLLSGFTASAQVPLAGYITTIGGSYPTHLDSLGMGGYMTTYNKTTRDAIPTLRRKVGMMVRYSSADSTFVLSGGIANSNWVPFTTAVDVSGKANLSGGNTFTGNQYFQDIHTNSIDDQLGIISQGTIVGVEGFITSGNINALGDFQGNNFSASGFIRTADTVFAATIKATGNITAATATIHGTVTDNPIITVTNDADADILSLLPTELYWTDGNNFAIKGHLKPRFNSDNLYDQEWYLPYHLDGSIINLTGSVNGTQADEHGNADVFNLKSLELQNAPNVTDQTNDYIFNPGWVTGLQVGTTYSFVFDATNDYFVDNTKDKPNIIIDGVPYGTMFDFRLTGSVEPGRVYQGYWDGTNIFLSQNPNYSGTSVTAGSTETGTLNVYGGSPAIGKVLTSDASGNATWQTLSSSGWSLSGNSGTSASTNFMGNTDDVSLNFRINNEKSGKIESDLGSNKGTTFYGYKSGNSNTGQVNTGIGLKSLYTNSTGEFNTGLGGFSLFSNTTGLDNTALGALALNTNSTGSYNTSIGVSSLDLATSSNNTAVGYNALHSLATGANNTAVGYNANVGTNNLTNATAIGYNSTVTASNTIQLGDANVTTVNVGTGTTAKIVAGGLQVTGGTPAVAEVLTSDASGNATWSINHIDIRPNLDFPNTLPGTSSQISVTLTGANVGDLVVLGSVSESSNSCYTAFVETLNTVTIKFNNYGITAINPVIGSYRIRVFTY